LQKSIKYMKNTILNISAILKIKIIQQVEWIAYKIVLPNRLKNKKMYGPRMKMVVRRRFELFRHFVV
jgi:hypothetical protein